MLSRYHPYFTTATIAYLKISNYSKRWRRLERLSQQCDILLNSANHHLIRGVTKEEEEEVVFEAKKQIARPFDFMHRNKKKLYRKIKSNSTLTDRSGIRSQADKRY